MIPVQFPQATAVGTGEGFNPLPLYQDNELTITKWQLTDEELAHIATTKSVWVLLSYSSPSIIPMMLQVEEPFVNVEQTEIIQP